MTTMNDLKNLVEQTLAQNDIWARCGEVRIQAYENRLAGGGVQFNIKCGTPQDEPDVGVMEGTPGMFTIAVTEQKGKSIDYTNTEVFTMADPLEALCQAFPYEHIRHIVGILLAH